MKNKWFIMAAVLIILFIIAVSFFVNNSGNLLNDTETSKTQELIEQKSESTEGQDQEREADTAFLPENETTAKEPGQIIQGSDGQYGSHPDDTEHIDEEILFGDGGE